VSYTGTVDETAVSDHIRGIGALLTDAGEVGFVLVYHAVDEPGTGRMQLAGTGISQTQLGTLFADALEHNSEYGSTT
jgi:hypothetical protein